ncbi:MAG: hypothetical protein ABI184_04895 [Ginsengibacter sp.]
MKLEFNYETKIKEVQKEFSKVYPFLKIEFLKKPHAVKELTYRKFRLNPGRLLSEESKSFNPSEIDIRKNKTVAELEKEVYEKLGIAMQVSCKSGNIWLETSFTGDRTLEMQNQQGQPTSFFSA